MGYVSSLSRSADDMSNYSVLKRRSPSRRYAFSLSWYRAARIRVKTRLSDTLALRYQEWRGGGSDVVLPARIT